MGIQRHMGNQLGGIIEVAALYVRTGCAQSVIALTEKPAMPASYPPTRVHCVCDPVGPPHHAKGEEREMETGRAEFE